MKQIHVIGVVCIGALMFTFGWLSKKAYETPITPSVVRENSSLFKFINPLLLSDNSRIEFTEYNALEQLLERSVKERVDAQDAETISVYFRDLNSGKWTGINEKELYAPSSMLKLTTLIAYLKLIEDDPKILDYVIDYTPVVDPGQFFKPKKVLLSGKRTVRELLITMITESDNEAMHVLNLQYPEKVISIYKELNLPDPIDNPTDFMSAEQYSNIYRILYNSTYLSRIYSEEALKILSVTSFTTGISAGVGSTTVSHKFGEHTQITDGEITERQLHDCGIVYIPDNPYFICVMTRGSDFQTLTTIIQDISKKVYTYTSR